MLLWNRVCVESLLVSQQLRRQMLLAAAAIIKVGTIRAFAKVLVVLITARRVASPLGRPLSPSACSSSSTAAGH
jgi:hypothetical protein